MGYDKERASFFEEHYHPSFLLLNFDRKKYIGTKGKCRFCGKSMPEATFKNEAHAFPEAMGNRVLISNDECDTCNDMFSKTVEDHFAKFSIVERSLMRIPGKSRRPPSYKSKNEEVRIDHDSNKIIKVKSTEGNPDVVLNAEAKQLEITGYNQPYIPRLVFKCLVKMALAIMPEEELVNFKETLQWLQSPISDKDIFSGISLVCGRSFVPGPKPFPIISAFLFKRKRDDAPIPYMVFHTTFGNYAYQIFVPTLKDRHLNGQKATIPFFPNMYDHGNEYGNQRHTVLDLSSSELVKDQRSKMVMKYQERKSIDNPE